MVIWLSEDDARDSRRPLPQGKSEAAERGQTLKEFVTEALQEKVAPKRGTARPQEPEPMQGFGKLRRFHKEAKAIPKRIHEAFETVEPEDRG